LSSDTAVQNNVMGLTYTVDSHAVNTMVFVAQHGQEVANGVANGSKSETAPLPARWQRNSHLRQASEVLDSHFCNIQETEHSHCTICVALNSMTHWTARLIDKILTQDPTSATYCSSLINIITLFPKHFRWGNPLHLKMHRRKMVQTLCEHRTWLCLCKQNRRNFK
jgi:hypothetical protein